MLVIHFNVSHTSHCLEGRQRRQGSQRRKRRQGRQRRKGSQRRKRRQGRQEWQERQERVNLPLKRRKAHMVALYSCI